MPNNQSADKPLLISRSAAGEAEARALRMFIGRGKEYSVKEVSNRTGVKDRAIECAMAGPDNADWRPLPAGALHSLMSFLGPDFVTAWLNPTPWAAHDPAVFDHDTLALKAMAYATEHSRARHPSSPGGVDITAQEKAGLERSAADLGAH